MTQLLLMVLAVAVCTSGYATKSYAFIRSFYDLPGELDDWTHDHDGDGSKDLEEYFHGTDPTDAQSLEKLAIFQAASGSVTLAYRHAPDTESVSARVLVSPSLAPASWTPLELDPDQIVRRREGAFDVVEASLPLGGIGSQLFFSLELIPALPNLPSHNFAQMNPAADGVTDDGPKFKAFFQMIQQAGGGQVRIPPGTYLIGLGRTNQCPIPSNTTVDATGAVFQFPELAPAGTVFAWLRDTNVVNFVWKNGHFIGHAFDVNRNPHTANTWHPNAHVRCIHISTSKGGRTENILFDGISTDGVQGTALTVAGALESETVVDTYATNVTLRRLHMNRTGPLHWDYGFLWQRIVWAHEYDENNVSLAHTYFNPTLFTNRVSAAAGTRIEFDNSARRVNVSTANDLVQSVCFYGKRVDANLVRGVAYVVVAADDSHIKVSSTLHGTPITLAGDSEDMYVLNNVFTAFFPMLNPYGAPNGEAAHGAYMVDAAVDVRAVDCYIANGNGDSMLIKISTNVIFTGNTFLGTRMGAVWIGDRCNHVLVASNYVDGGNGSRVLSVERSSKNVVVRDNTFVNGGRGSWINQPAGILISNNVFRVNTGKNTPDPYLGRRSYQNGLYENWEEIYFTRYSEGLWGPITIVNNIFDAGTNNASIQAIRIHGGAQDIFIGGNTFQGSPVGFWIESIVERLTFGENSGILTTNHGHYVKTTTTTTYNVVIPHGLADNSFWLTVPSTVTANNPDTTLGMYGASPTELIVNFNPPIPAGRTIDFHWTTYLKWR